MDIWNVNEIFQKNCCLHAKRKLKFIRHIKLNVGDFFFYYRWVPKVIRKN